MTWHTSCGGERVLLGAEARLFAIGIPTISDYYCDDIGRVPNATLGEVSFLAKFTELNPDQQFTVLLEVATALLTETDECPNFNHINEGAIAYVYGFLKMQFECCDFANEIWGEYILDAYNEVVATDKYNIKKLTMESMKDEDDWLNVITELEDRILWDRDFEYYQICDDYAQDIPDYYNSCHSNIQVNPDAENLLCDLCSKIAYPDKYPNDSKKRKIDFNDDNNNSDTSKIETTQHEKSKKMKVSEDQEEDQSVMSSYSCNQFQCYKLSSEEGNAYAQYKLALCYNDGVGTKKTIVKHSNGINYLQNKEILMRSINLPIVTIMEKELRKTSIKHSNGTNYVQNKEILMLSIILHIVTIMEKELRKT